MKVVITDLENINTGDLDGFLEQDPDNLVYASHAYLSLLKEYLNCDIFLVLAYKENKIAGYFPLAIKQYEHGAICNSLPYYGSNGSMIISKHLDEEETAACMDLLLQHAEKLVADKKCIATTFITNPLNKNSNPFLKDHFNYDFIDERTGQITLLPEDQPQLDEALLKLFDDPRPRNIRKAIKSGITVHADSLNNQIDFLYKVHHENITAIGGRAKEKKIFEMIDNYFSSDNCKVYVAQLENKPVAALLLLYFNKTVEYFTPAVVEEYRSLQPTALIIFEAMKDAVRSGYDKWNWGGTWLTQKGVYDFKKKWGAQDFPYFYYTKVYDKNILRLDKQELLERYPDFFVLPFSQLQPS